MLRVHAEAFLFDSDGVLVDSDAAVVSVWGSWAAHWGLDPDEVVPQVHGTPSRRTVARFVPEAHRAEALAMVDAAELALADTAVALPGAVDLLVSLPAMAWAIVTSGTGTLARARLAAAGIPAPAVLVTADDVRRGKPDPEPYLTAAAGLGRPVGSSVVFEDAAAGVASARAAGVRHVIAVGTHVDGVDGYATDLRQVRIADGTVTVAGPAR